MIFGESGGGAKTSCLYAMPAAAPFFNKASIESGPGIRMMPRDMATETTMMVLKELGLGKTDWRKLLEVPGEKLLGIQDALGRRPGGPLTMSGGRKGIGGGGRPGGFGPVVDGIDPAAPSRSIPKRRRSRKTSRSWWATTATRPSSSSWSAITPTCST